MRPRDGFSCNKKNEIIKSVRFGVVSNKVGQLVSNNMRRGRR